jgi:hypothetical protein
VFSSICEVNELPEKVYGEALETLQEALTGETKTATREYLFAFKNLLAKFPKCYQYIDQCIMQYKKLWKPFFFREQFTGGLHSHFRHATLIRYFRDHLVHSGQREQNTV